MTNLAQKEILIEVELDELLENPWTYFDCNLLVNGKEVRISVDEFAENPLEWDCNPTLLSLLRRYNMISIMEVLPQNDNYIFVVSINDDLLRTNDNALQQKIESIRTQEWDYYNEAFKKIKKAILQSGKSCSRTR